MCESQSSTHLDELRYTHCNTLRHTATHCNTLSKNAVHCNTLQHTATHCNTSGCVTLNMRHTYGRAVWFSVCSCMWARLCVCEREREYMCVHVHTHTKTRTLCSMLQCVAVCVQYVAVCLQYVAVCCIVWQNVAVCCSFSHLALVYLYCFHVRFCSCWKRRTPKYTCV